MLSDAVMLRAAITTEAGALFTWTHVCVFLASLTSFPILCQAKLYSLLTYSLTLKLPIKIDV